MSYKKWGGLLCAVAVTVFALWIRLEYQANTLIDNPGRGDASQYIRIAMNLVEHGVVSMEYPSEGTPRPDSYRGPGYPLLVALAMQLGEKDGWYVNLLFMQTILGTLSVALTMLIAQRWLPLSYTLAAGLLAAVWPHMVTMSGNVLSETFYGFTLLLAMYLLCRAESSGRPYWYALAGFAFAYAALINPSILLFPVFIGAFFIFTRRKYAVLFLLCSLVVPLAWSARGAMLDSGRTSSGRFMETVLVGMEPDFEFIETPSSSAPRARVNEGLERFERSKLDALHAVVTELAHKPAFYLQWYVLEKPLFFWQWSFVHGDGDIYMFPVFQSPFQDQPFFRVVAALCSSLNIWLMAAAFCLVPWVATSAARQDLQRKDAALIYVVLLFAYATAMHTVLTPDPRYATPYRPFEIMLALSFVALLQQRWRAQKAVSP